MAADGPLIHPTAIIEEGAVIGEGTTVGPFSIIGSRVVLGKGNRIGPHVVITGHTRLGDRNEVFQFASIGAKPQDLKYQGEDSRLEIGDENRIREYVTLQPGTKGGGMVTRIGNRNLFMACSHIGHDGTIGDDNIFANSAGLAGHVTVGNRVIVGGLAGVHQFVRIGDLAMLGAGAMVGRDVPPYCIAQGDHAELVGINQVGLQRAGWTSEEIARLRSFYRRIFRGVGPFRERLAAVREECAADPKAAVWLAFCEKSERGIMFARGAGGGEGD